MCSKLLIPHCLLDALVKKDQSRCNFIDNYQPILNLPISAFTRLLQSNLFDTSLTPSALRRPQSTDLSRLSSYLTHGYYSVSVGHFKSEKVSILRGVPQGCTLGILAFNLSTLPPVCIINKHNIPYHSYADNTQIYTSVSRCWSCFLRSLFPTALYHLRNISWIGAILDSPHSQKLVIAFSSSRFDCCNETSIW